MIKLLSDHLKVLAAAEKFVCGFYVQVSRRVVNTESCIIAAVVNLSGQLCITDAP